MMKFLIPFLFFFQATGSLTSPSLLLAESEKGEPRYGIAQATGATVGILKGSEPETDEATKSRFSVRASGIHLQNGYIITARHAVKTGPEEKPVIPESIMVLTGTLDEFPATLIGVDRFLDIAVYRLDEVGDRSGLPTIAFSSKAPDPGDEVFTIGYPLGWGPAVAFGRLGNPNTYLPTMESRLYQVDLSACSGNSGGGLFNEKGELVGIVHAIIQTGTILEERRCSRFAFAVPGLVVKRIANAIIEKKRFGFSRLGTQLTAVKVGNRWRVAVSGVTQPARDAGLLKGDILVSIGDTPITSAAQLKSFLTEQTTPGQKITVTVLRGKEEHKLQVTLGAS